MSDTTTSSTPPPAPAAPDYADIAKGMEAPPEEAAPAAKAEAPVTEKPAEAPKTEAPKAEEPFAKSFEKLAAEKAALRKEMEQAKPFLDALKVLPPTSINALARAIQANDPLAVLAAAGYSYADLANRVVEGTAPKAAEKPEPKPENSGLPPDVQKEIAELREFRKQYAERQAQEQRQQITAKVKDVVKGEKFRHIDALGEHDAILAVIQDYHAKTGEMPGATFEESVLAAAEVVEKRLAEQATRWQKVLTPVSAPTTVPATAKSESPARQEISGKTLTNKSASAPVAAAPSDSIDPADLRKALISDPNW